MRRGWGRKEVVWDGWPEFAQACSTGCLDSRGSGGKLPRFVVGRRHDVVQALSGKWSRFPMRGE